MFIYSFINKYIFYLFSEILQLKKSGFSLPKPPFFQTTYDIYDLNLFPVAQAFSKGQSVEECLSVQNIPYNFQAYLEIAMRKGNYIHS